MIHKKIQVILVIFLSLIIAAGCSSNSRAPDGDFGQSPTTTGGTTGYESGKNVGADPSVIDDPDRKIIRNASVELKAVDVMDTYEAVLAHAVELGGYEFQRIWNRNNDQIRIDAEIRINPDQLDALVSFVESQAEVIASNISSENITDAYYDAQTRLRSMETALERYYDFMDDADTIEEILQVQYQLDSLTLDIEALKGRLTLWDRMLAESVLTLRIYPITDPVQARKDINWSALSFSDMGYLIQLGFTRVGNTIISAGQWAVIALAVASPVWVTGTIIILVLRRKARKRRKASDESLESFEFDDDVDQE